MMCIFRRIGRVLFQLIFNTISKKNQKKKKTPQGLLSFDNAVLIILVF